MYNSTTKLSSNKYRKYNRDKLTIDMKKGKKEIYKTYAATKGLTLTNLIITLLEKEMENDLNENNS